MSMRLKESQVTMNKERGGGCRFSGGGSINPYTSFSLAALGTDEPTTRRLKAHLISRHKNQAWFDWLQADLKAE